MTGYWKRSWNKLLERPLYNLLLAALLSAVCVLTYVNQAPWSKNILLVCLPSALGAHLFCGFAAAGWLRQRHR